ncbi:MAG: G5 domain-containing protein, partial [Candidatus Omnitrophica bacterium]|nr:G5 domain-containing protein [Candidatus Omnitrophota bacterium]
KEVTSEGQNGIEITRIRVRLEDGKEASRETENTVVLQVAVARQVTYGSKIVYHTLDTGDGTITYYRAVTVRATAYSPCRSATKDGSCSNITSSGKPVVKGVIGTTLTWYKLFKGDQLYVPGYGVGTVEDVGGGISGQYWIDLGYSDADFVGWYKTVTIYFLAPAPDNVPVVLP